MKTSVIIPVHNRENFIGAAIRSLLRQRGAAELDIIVVDDGSTDDTAQIVEAMGRGDACIRLFRAPKSGVARARNIGLANVRDDAHLVTFLDSDDISVENRFALEVPLFCKDPELEMTYSLMTLADVIDDDQLMPAPEATTLTLRGISLTTALFRKSAVEKIGKIDEGFQQAEDWDFLLRFFERSDRYRVVDNVSVIYRRHPGNTTLDREEGHRDFMRATLLSAQRRRKNPSLRSIPNIFNLNDLNEGRYESLR
jgi:glycosyltransferase involved in cell wall biosynthesis